MSIEDAEFEDWLNEAGETGLMGGDFGNRVPYFDSRDREMRT